uniref:Septum formation protein Maf n=1 Tax=Eucampia antarctica TaxID=49252 RepID=A0A7S2W9X1_9STRA
MTRISCQRSLLYPQLLFYCCMYSYFVFCFLSVESFCPSYPLSSNTINTIDNNNNNNKGRTLLSSSNRISFIVPVSMKMSTTSSNPPGGNMLVSKMNQIGKGGKVDLILASQSPRRREILDMMGLKGRYTVMPSPLDESALQQELLLSSSNDIHPTEYTRILAERKAQALGDALLRKNEDSSKTTSTSTTMTLILGSDTIVDMDGKILEKPADEESAIQMIQSLAGNWHQVHTGVALYCFDGNNNKLECIHSFTDTARVKFANLTQNDIEAYVQTGEPMDKAGAYGIQGIGGQLVEKLEGDFFTVMGLPMHKLSLALAKAIN